MSNILRSPVLHVILIAAAVVAVYANSLGGEFVFDDKAMISAYDLVKDIANIPKAFVSATSVYGNVNYYRPLQTITYITDYFLWGDLPSGFHVTGILWHVAASLAVYAFVLLLFSNSLTAFATALLFAVHPVNSGVVAYIAGRADAMVLVFTLLCLIFYIRARYGSGWAQGYVLSLVFFATALLTKESAMMIPAIIVFIDKYGRKCTLLDGTRARNRDYVPFLVILAAYVYFRMTRMSFFVEGAVPPAPFFNRLITAPYALAQYFRLTVLPYDLHIGREIWLASSVLDPRIVLSLVFTAAVFYAGYRRRASDREIWFGLLWFALLVLPSLNIITPLFYTVADNWMYAPAVGLYLAIVYGVHKIYLKMSRPPHPWLKYSAPAALAVFIIALGAVTAEHNKTWKDEIAVGMNTLRFNPRDHKVYNNMGVYYLGKRELSKAEEAFKKCLEIKPDTGMAYFNLYRVYMAEGRRAEALACLEKGRQLDPARVNLLIEKMGIRD